MIRRGELEDRAVGPALSERQAEAAALVREYYGAARELPSAGWLSRQLHISRERARQHIEALRRRNVLPLSK